MASTLWVRILAFHVECAVCGDTQCIDQPQHDDAFTQQVLEPLYAWFMAHRMPQIVEVIMTTEREEVADDGVDSTD